MIVYCRECGNAWEQIGEGWYGDTGCTCDCTVEDWSAFDGDPIDLLDQLIAVVWPAFSGGDIELDDFAGVMAVVRALLAAPHVLGAAYFADLAGVLSAAPPAIDDGA